MKKKILIIFSILVVSLAITCFVFAFTQSKEHDVREIVWNKLSTQQKNQIIGTWRDATLEKVIADDIAFYPLEDPEYYSGKELYRVKFNTTNDGLLGPIIVYIDPKTREIVGYGYRL